MHVRFIEMFMDAENLIASLKDDIEKRLKDIQRMEKNQPPNESLSEFVAELVDSNAEDALTCMYAQSLIDVLSPQVDAVRLLSDLVDGRPRNNIFNRRYEDAVFGDE